MTGALLTTVSGVDVTGALVARAVVDGGAHADVVAAVAVAGRGQVERRIRRARDVAAVADPLIARRERVAVGVVARHFGRQRLVGRRRRRA